MEMAKANILVVEDESISALDIQNGLKRLGYHVCATATSGEAAIQKAAAIRPDLVLMDIRLEGAVDGVEAAEQIRSRFGIPVIFLTAYADDHTLQRVKAAEPFGYLLKPFRARELHSAIALALHRQKTEAHILQYNHKLLALQAASAAIASSLDPQHVWETVAREMASLLEVKACAAFEWNPGAEALYLLAHYSNNDYREAGLRAVRVECFRLDEHPLTEQTLLERHPLQIWFDQPDLDPTALTYLQATNAKTLLVLPMVYQDRVLGTIEITDSSLRTFTDLDISLAQLLANQAASAIENARLYDEVRRRASELTTLNKIGQAITSSLDLHETLTIITDHITRLLGVEATSLALRHSTDGDLWFVAASGAGADFVRGKRLPINQGIVGWTIQHGEPALVPNVTQDPRFFDGFDQKSGFTTRSVLSIPLQTKGHTVGVIEVMNKHSGHFDQDDLGLLISLAAPAAAAVENAHLYHKAQQEITQRARAEAALEAERASLAQRVAHRTAELRQANAELAELARLKDRFVSNVSHELRTPLSVLTLLSGNLDMFYHRWDEDKRRQTVRDIRGQARVLHELIESVLEISRIDNGRVSTDQQSVDLAAVAREEVEKQLPLAQQKSHTLQVTGIESLNVSGDKGQLHQVIRNLLNNAVKYTLDGGHITCECRVQSGNGLSDSEWPGAADLPPGRWGALRVVDTGIGVSQEHLPKLFERFYRVNEQGKAPGVGLGLSIAKELIELHDGHIAVSSTLGKGSVFAFYLPLSEE